MNLVEEVHLIFADVKENHNKFWNGFLYDDSTVIVEWGRVGASTKKNMGQQGKRFLDRKKGEKLRKGYTELPVVTGKTTTVVTQPSQLHEIAKKQIKTSDPIVDQLVERLVKANIHKIVSHTDIKYDVASGVFSTPLGIVTSEGIQSARSLLSDIDKQFGETKSPSSIKVETINFYLRIIPQKVKGKLDIAKIFPNQEAIKQQALIFWIPWNPV